MAFSAARQPAHNQTMTRESMKRTVTENNGSHARCPLRSGENLADLAPVLNRHDTDAILINCSRPEAVSTAVDIAAQFGRTFGAYANGFTKISQGFLQEAPTVDALQERQRRHVGEREGAGEPLAAVQPEEPLQVPEVLWHQIVGEALPRHPVPSEERRVAQGEGVFAVRENRVDDVAVRRITRVKPGLAGHQPSYYTATWWSWLARWTVFSAPSQGHRMSPCASKHSQLPSPISIHWAFKYSPQINLSFSIASSNPIR